MRKITLLAVAIGTLSAAAVMPASSQVVVSGWNAGCYRMGDAGFKWYGFCLGPNIAYPHKKVCDHGACTYQW
jgi:hypothetical protein